jgi:RNA polymerase sigma-70 factor, ECF subfamily
MDPERTGHESSVALLSNALGDEAMPRTTGAALEFTAVYREYFGFVWRSCKRLGVAERYVDDAVQDVFVVIHRRLVEFEGRSTLKSWIFGITRRVARDHRRRSMRKDKGEALPENGVADPRAPSPSDEVARAEAARVLHDILDSLDDDKREAFVLAELEQMTVPEIAAATDTNVNTVYSRLRAARQAFEQAVARHHARERRLVR